MRVAVLGLGRMGAPIAERLEQAGHELSVWNRSAGPEEAFAGRGVRVLGAPAEAWEHADACITMLADGPAVEAVAPQLLTDGADGVLVDMSTIGADTSARVAAECDRRGVEFLRAPVTGNPSVVVAGNLGIIVSGPRDAFERLGDTLRDIGPNVFHVGEAEEARIVKLGLNLMIAGTAQLMAEALVLAEAAGIDAARVPECLAGGHADGSLLQKLYPRMVKRDFAPLGYSRQLLKDLEMVNEFAGNLKAPVPMMGEALSLYRMLVHLGHSELDTAAIFKLYERT